MNGLSVKGSTLRCDQHRLISRAKNGTKDNVSYLLFEDRLGSESFDMHAENDMYVSVENDKRMTVDGAALLRLTRSHRIR
ncbi:bacteriophage T4 gp5 trimerisation domain-containing protein [Affinibrenneria salicis]|uniref:bacteriophage T4 gp5 trimerisation domain-containing protein n=1 Tax=Affinibrenneria salicis TaxID=2590031 RepID=UPI0037C0BAED